MSGRIVDEISDVGRGWLVELGADVLPLFLRESTRTVDQLCFEDGDLLFDIWLRDVELRIESPSSNGCVVQFVPLVRRGDYDNSSVPDTDSGLLQESQPFGDDLLVFLVGVEPSASLRE